MVATSVLDRSSEQEVQKQSADTRNDCRRDTEIRKTVAKILTHSISKQDWKLKYKPKLTERQDLLSISNFLLTAENQIKLIQHLAAIIEQESDTPSSYKNSEARIV